MNRLANGIGWIVIMILNFICTIAVDKQNYFDMNFIIVGIALGMSIINIAEYINERK